MNDASARQRHAADPRASTWLSANAGSGKTRVLTDRVARLLLDGVDPRNVLCLTYTKAAAAEMQNRLFNGLGEWAMLDDANLRCKLEELGFPGELDPATLDRARTLFARAIETPGGLRLQTIHAFCASILRRFPLEAGLTPSFTEIDETAQAALIARLLDEMAGGPDAAVIDGLADHSGIDVTQIAKAVAARREAFAPPRDIGRVRALFGVAVGETEETVLAGVFDSAARDLIAQIRDACSGGSKVDVKACEALSTIHLADPTIDDLEVLEGVVLNSSGENAFQAKLGKFPTLPTRARLAADAEIDALMQRVADARPRRLALAAAERTGALHAFAGAFLPRYEAARAAAGWVDYDDLILKVRRLMEDPDVADWVLYRLDGGIDHILVDEAQDTSPGQWQVIERLAAEFAAGRGAHGELIRTLFVVGDLKQSIYSFQGADPASFERVAASFGGRLASGVRRLELVHSFRSSSAILETVDRLSAGLPGLGLEVKHRAFHAAQPGRVDLWPIVPQPEKPTPTEWSQPRDLSAPNAAHVVLAGKIAGWLKTAIDGREPIPDRDGQPHHLRPLRPGDILILFQRRNEMFHDTIRALKAAQLPVAGADRLKLIDELAVRDLLALLSFLALPEDDLSLAVALRSPLFGWSEAQLYDLAHGRDGFLWVALRNRDDHAETRAMLWDLLSQADFARPYELLERILVRHDGRGRLLARLGSEAEDGVDELLNKALDYERTEVASLTGFLSWIQAEEVEVRRQPDAAGDRIRVMTVHGAKGLEAPMVILPDTLREEAKLRDQIVMAEGGIPCWKMKKNDEPPILSTARAAKEAADTEERNRLLYVASTRAKSWLVVCGAGEQRGQGGNWHSTMETALRDHAARCTFPTSDCTLPLTDGLRLERGDWSAPPEVPFATSGVLPAKVPDGPVTPPRLRPEPLRASDLGGAKALPGDGLDEETAKARGTDLHLLLEHLPGRPAAERESLAEQLLGRADSELVAEASAVLDAPALAGVFSPDALAEVDVSAMVPEFDEAPLRGTIDRLLVGPDSVLCIDFKSNRKVPATPEEVPDGILRQMGAYASALAVIYTGRRIETAILWTRAATLMRLPRELTNAALLDAHRARS
jgi:ATP-dependent helicase/nuclease subunit A